MKKLCAFGAATVAALTFGVAGGGATFGSPFLFKDINPNGSSNPSNFTMSGGKLFFTADDGTHGTELWVSDGTANGTQMVSDLNPSAGSNPTNLTDINGTLFFDAQAGSVCCALYKTDGTTVTFLGSWLGGAGWLTNVNGTLFFEVLSNDQLWKSNGTQAGTQIVKDTNPNGSSQIFWLAAVGSTLFFACNDGSGRGQELCSSDGTSNGTGFVRDINQGSGTSNPQYLTNVNGTLYFAADDGSSGVELYKSDGTTIGTTRVADIYSGAGSSNPQSLTSVNGTLYFVATSPGMFGSEDDLWKTDGAGTFDLTAPERLGPSWLTNVNGTLFFAGSNTGYLYKSNGTSVTPLLDFFRVPANLTNANATLVFSVERFDNNGLEPWQSDGTNTTLIGDVNPGMNSSFPGPFAFVGGKLVFAADDGTHGRELYASLLQVPTAVTVAGFTTRRKGSRFGPVGP